MRVGSIKFWVTKIIHEASGSKVELETEQSPVRESDGTMTLVIRNNWIDAFKVGAEIRVDLNFSADDDKENAEGKHEQNDV